MTVGKSGCCRPQARFSSAFIHRSGLRATDRAPSQQCLDVHTQTAEIRRVIRAAGGVISRRQHPELVPGLNWMCRSGEIVSVFPGVYVPPARQGDLDVRLRALVLWEPDAVLTGRTAARLTFWPELDLRRLSIALPRHRECPAGVELVRRRIPPELVVHRGPLRLTSPALTALDLCAEQGGDAIDTVLRSRRATLEQLWEALRSTPHRRGNQDRRWLLMDSRDEPWSNPERLFHRLLREQRITGWQANHLVWLAGGECYLDVGFPACKLAIEIDGREFHTSRAAFESDRWRQNELELQGWLVLRFTYEMITKFPNQVIMTIWQALARLA